jgi:hypothetical protein
MAVAMTVVNFMLEVNERSYVLTGRKDRRVDGWKMDDLDGDLYF